jgi:hypothetical protein
MAAPKGARGTTADEKISVYRTVSSGGVNGGRGNGGKKGFEVSFLSE